MNEEEEVELTVDERLAYAYISAINDALSMMERWDSAQLVELHDAAQAAGIEGVGRAALAVSMDAPVHVRQRLYDALFPDGRPRESRSGSATAVVGSNTQVQGG